MTVASDVVGVVQFHSLTHNVLILPFFPHFSLCCSFFRRMEMMLGLAQLVVAWQYKFMSFFIHHLTKHLVRRRKRALASERYVYGESEREKTRKKNFD